MPATPDDVTSGAVALLGPTGPVLAPLPDLGLADERDTVFALEMARTDDLMLAVIQSGHDAEGMGMQQLAQRLAARPDIKAAILTATAALAEMREATITRKTVEGAAWKLFEKADAANRMTDAKGLLELYSKLKSYLVERKEVTHRLTVEQLTDEELERIAARGKRPVMIDAESRVVEADEP